MTNIADAFLYLTAFGSTARQFELKTRELDMALPAGPVLVGVDAVNGLHLLLPIGGAKTEEDRRSKHVVVVESTYGTNENPARYVDLHCRTPSLGRMFEQLAEDVVTRLKEGDDPATVCQRTLDDWRYLLERERGSLGFEEILGLHGELHVLQLLAQHSPLRAVDIWQGPLGSPQDFLSHGRALEVKTTRSVDASTIRVSNAAQLDPEGLESLDLLLIQVSEDDRGQTLDERVEKALAAGAPQRHLIERVQQAGYDYGSGQSTEPILVRECFHWRVTPDFPSLRAADIDPTRRMAISHVSYDLTLTGSADHTGEDEIRAFLSHWIERDGDAA
ncbi:PD-(D/E)XK motif protein [Enemella sp. A6]|uniref:PD-(D/E)XK motif protein n=1 Tax=Enemella sp. A6 TaxID=3440152 RepID=UPI003EC12DDD